MFNKICWINEWQTFSPPYKDNSLGPLKKAFLEKLIWTWKCDYFKNNRSKYISLLRETWLLYRISKEDDCDFLLSRCIKAHQTSIWMILFQRDAGSSLDPRCLLCRVMQPGKCIGACTKGSAGFHSNMHSFPRRILSSLLPTQTFQNELIFVTIGVCPWSSKEKRHTHQINK